MSDRNDRELAHWQWAVAFDCEAEGCHPPHVDNGYVMAGSWDGTRSTATPDRLPGRVNNHAVKRVRRYISEWMDAPPLGVDDVSIIKIPITLEDGSKSEKAILVDADGKTVAAQG